MELIEDLEREHDPLTAAVAALSALVTQVEAGEVAPDAMRERFMTKLEELREQLLEHFGREEECFFPFFTEALPEVREEVQALEAAHDSISGSLTRLLTLAGRNGRAFAEHFAHVAHVFRRFEASYTEHARSERLVLRRAAEELDEAQRVALARAADGLL